MKILAIGAHPDDIEIFMYGFLALNRNLGHQIFLIVATDGSAGNVIVEKNLSSKRKKETISGLQNLGKPFFCTFKDGDLNYTIENRNIIKDQINIVKPNLIITHSKNDYHSDHRILSRLAKDAANFDVPILYCETLMGINFNPDYYVDITNVFDEKASAIMAHETQNPEKFLASVTLMNRYRSAQCNYFEGYAECYSFDRTFPFTDINSLLIHNISINPFYSRNSKSLL